MKNLLKEIRDLIRYLRLPLIKKLILVYSEHSGYTINFIPTVKAIISEYNTEICFVTSQADDPILLFRNQGITALYCKKLLPFLFANIDSPVCLMTMPDLGAYYIKRSVNNVRYIYIFHALMSTHMIYREKAFDNFDAILCTGGYQIDEIRRNEELHSLKKKELTEAGYTRLDDIYSEYQNHKGPLNSKKKILIAPGWSKDNILDTCGVQITTSLVAAGFDVILRYHPETVKRRKDLIERYDNAFADNPAVLIEKSVADNNSLLTADLLITDWSGVSLEYAFGTERPVLYINTPRKILNENYQKLDIEPFEVSIRGMIGKQIELNETPDIVPVVQEIMAGAEKLKQTIIEIRDKNIFNFGKAKYANAKAIFEQLKAAYQAGRKNE
ncbi:MAG: CDP-glycerol glycerophosphotransferase family protein [Syntrophomonadaceae bacterium]|jgi:YidC/Oxa1 family membrane protein insertase|nr:CDP-glycerol glycerophosphotransferase family protein [Syntrophomonadaceae bacterium]